MILVTGNTGYIGSVMVPFLQGKGLKVVGFDTNYFDGCNFGSYRQNVNKQIIKDIRNVEESDLEGIEAVVHLAALSNDPLGKLNSSLTHDINFEGSVRLAKFAKKKGVKRFVYSSSCSLYGVAGGDRALTEEDKFNPKTAYAVSKVDTEREVSKLADDQFHPVFMRNATVYGASPRLRMDLVVNDLTAAAFLTKKVSILSDGTPWRPLIHVKDLCRAFYAVLTCPIKKIHNQAFNVGINSENYQIKDVAKLVKEVLPDSEIEIVNKYGPDERTYRVDFSKIKKELPEFEPEWTVKKGIEELAESYQVNGLTKDIVASDRFIRLKRINKLIEENKLDSSLNWRSLETV